MKAIRHGVAGLILVLLLSSAQAGEGKCGHAIVKTFDEDISAFDSEDESAGALRMSFGPDGSLFLVHVVKGPEEDRALAWRRIGADGLVSQASRIPLIEGMSRQESLKSLIVTEDGVTWVAHSTAFRTTDEPSGSAKETFAEIHRFAFDGQLIGTRSLGVIASRVRMTALGTSVALVYDPLTDGSMVDNSVVFAVIGPDGEFSQGPKRVSRARAGDDPLLVTRIMDLFLGVDSKGVARILYRLVEGRFDGSAFETTSGPEVVWNSVSTSGVVSAPVSLGAVPNWNGSWRAAFAPDGSACVVSHRGYESDPEFGSFPSPLLVSPEGIVEVVPVSAFPRIVTSFPGEQVGVAVDAASVFHVAAFATSPSSVESRPGDSPSRAVHVSTVSSDGSVIGPARVRLKRKPQYIWSFEVAGDGTTVVAGDTARARYRLNRSRWREDVTLIFLDRSGRPLKVETLKSPYMTNIRQPVLASWTGGAGTRMAAAWSGWWMPDNQGGRQNRYVRVVIHERPVRELIAAPGSDADSGEFTEDGGPESTLMWK